MPKTILITGSSRGIGRATAELAHAKGYTVIVHGKSDSQALQTVHESLKGSYKLVFDVADSDATHKVIGGFISSHGAIDILVNNAGIAKNFLKDISEVSDEHALEEYKVNVLGTIHCIQAVLAGMLKKGGSVINVASIKASFNLATMSTLTYATTKSGVLSLTKSLAKAYPTVRFNAISPGYVETDQVSDWNDETFERINNGTILGRIARPAEIAPLILFLASDDASYITGTEFLVDGGYSIKGK